MADLGLSIAESISAKRVGQYRTGCTVESPIAEATLTVGRLVCQGTDDVEAKVPAASGDVTESARGVVAYEPVGYSTDTIAIGEPFTCVRKGPVCVAVEDLAVAGQHPFVRITADAGGPAGAARSGGSFRSDADGGEAVELTRAVFRSSVSGVGLLAWVEIDLP
jgi:hypothetical protein